MKKRKMALGVVASAVLITLLCGCSCKRHTFESETVREPTCMVDGLTRKYCIKCDYTIEEEIPGYHKYQRESVIKDATCTTDGKAINKCSVCGRTEEVPIFASHSFSGRTCEVCGYKKPLPELSIGMSKFEVEMKWGEPIQKDIVKSTRGTSETWWYKENGRTIAVNFEVDGKVWLITQ